MRELVLIDNPLAKYYLSVLRDKNTTPRSYRDAARKLGFILGYEISRRLRWSKLFVETNLAKAEGLYPSKPVYIVGVLGASIPMMHGIWDALPWAGLGLVGAKRNIVNGDVEVEIFYERIPSDLSFYTVIIVDPTLASGRTMAKVADIVLGKGGRDIVAATILASKAGVEYFWSRHPQIPLYAVEIDPLLDERFFILPGIGDAGDRSLSSDYVTRY
ncbi:uracil phosphoribosyltransferase [Thermogladius sp. 4427co]|uniref:uracil phosphoribosyltransferase n=1 Tax=Thermogladius sp. 4427co TaxID=3450718 RepID=UPI003F7AE88A